MARCRVLRNPWAALTFIAALRHDSADAPCILNGPIKGDLFTAHIEQVQVPTLMLSEIVILANLGGRKRHLAWRGIRDARCPLGIPASL